jgi:hypothetical protein
VCMSDTSVPIVVTEYEDGNFQTQSTQRAQRFRSIDRSL